MQIRNIDLQNVIAKEDIKMTKIDVFVTIKASNVPKVWADLTSLEKTDIEENIKSIKAIPTIALKKLKCWIATSPVFWASMCPLVAKKSSENANKIVNS